MRITDINPFKNTLIRLEMMNGDLRMERSQDTRQDMHQGEQAETVVGQAKDALSRWARSLLAKSASRAFSDRGVACTSRGSRRRNQTESQVRYNNIKGFVVVGVQVCPDQ